MKSRAEDRGLLEPVNLSLQDPYDSVREIFKEYEFINIQPPETALIPVDTEVNEIFTEIKAMLEECLIENGIVIGNSNEKTFVQIKDTKDVPTNKENKAQTKAKGPAKTNDIELEDM